ncbi:hypothetical protein GCM10023334_125960 [Nonomuraea thailandensis]
MIWLTAFVPTYDVRQPALAVTSPMFAFPNLYNVNGTRTFTHPDLTQLPTDVGGDQPPLNMVSASWEPTCRRISSSIRSPRGARRGPVA